MGEEGGTGRWGGGRCCTAINSPAALRLGKRGYCRTFDVWGKRLSNLPTQQRMLIR